MNSPATTTGPRAGTAVSPARTAGGGALLVAGIVVAALNMRTGLSSVSPLVGELRDDFHLSATVGSLITVIPVLFLGVISPLAPPLARRYGNAATALAALVVLAVGITIRSTTSLTGIFLGGALVGSGIAILNVLMPGIIKGGFQGRISAMTGLYTSVMVFGAAMSAGTTVPIEDAIGSGWRPALAVWGVLSLAGIAVWLPLTLRNRATRTPGSAPTKVTGLWRSPLAWLVTGYMGLQSLLFYVLLAWMPTIFTDHGMGKGEAATVLAVSTFAQIPASLTMSLLAGRARRPVLLVLTSATGVMIGYGGLLLAPVSGAWLWAVLLGLGQGGAIALALTLIVMRAPDAGVAAQLSGMAQSVGYVMAAFGPLTAGVLRQATGGWTVPLAVMTVLALCQAAFGAGAARPGHVEVTRVG